MSGKFDEPAHWLELAEHTRTTVLAVRDAYAKRELLLIAQRYEILAERVKKRLQGEVDRETA